MSKDSPQATRQSHQSFFFESDIFSASRLLARRARPAGVVQEPARDVPVFRDCDVLVVGGGPSGEVPTRRPPPTGGNVLPPTMALSHGHRPSIPRG